MMRPSTLSREVINLDESDDDENAHLQGTPKRICVQSPAKRTTTEGPDARIRAATDTHPAVEDAAVVLDAIDLSQVNDQADLELVMSQSNGEAKAREEETSETACSKQAIEVFPDICRSHVAELYKESIKTGPITPQNFILKILESKEPYPKESARRKQLKRKREETDKAADPARIDYESPNRVSSMTAKGYEARCILQDEFPWTPVSFIQDQIRSQIHLYHVYMTLYLAQRSYDTAEAKPYRRLKHRRQSKDKIDRSSPAWLNEMTVETLQQPRCATDVMFKELSAARRKRIEEDARYHLEVQTQLAEVENERQHQESGMMMECQCCFCEYPFNKMTNCDGEDLHLFCLDCARRNANNEIGQSRYKLRCMDGSGCQAEFSREQIIRFLDDKTMEALSRIEQQEEIRLAGLDNLVHCPFCDFAAICPPVELDREFRCGEPDCGLVSCRLCKEETHIPLTCEAAAKSNKHTIRHAVEEAMTEALVRSCNKCQNKYVKEVGCNKMTCTRCRSVQCYVCSQTITASYAHFNDGSRGGKAGNCPLFDNTDQRHDEDVKKAEAAALARVRADHPTLDEAELKIQVSDAVTRDEQARLQAASQRHAQIYGPPAHPLNGPGWGPYNAHRAPPRAPPGPIPAYQPAAHVHNVAYQALAAQDMAAGQVEAAAQLRRNQLEAVRQRLMKQAAKRAGAQPHVPAAAAAAAAAVNPQRPAQNVAPHLLHYHPAAGNPPAAEPQAGHRPYQIADIMPAALQKPKQQLQQLQQQVGVPFRHLPYNPQNHATPPGSKPHAQPDALAHPPYHNQNQHPMPHLHASGGGGAGAAPLAAMGAFGASPGVNRAA